VDIRQAKKFRKNRLELIQSRSSQMSEQRKSTYEKNKTEIDFLIEKLAIQVSVSQPISNEDFKRLVCELLDALFYKRPSDKVRKFLGTLSAFPPSVVFQTILNFNMWMATDDNYKSKLSVAYFQGFLNKIMYQQRESSDSGDDRSQDIPDDL